LTLKNLVPMLNVADIDASLEFYRQVCGFEVVSDPAAIRQWRWATIRSGYTELMLSESGQAPATAKINDPQVETNWPVIFYFYPDDVVGLYAHVIAQGFEPTPLTVTVYDMREFSLIDPDGHVLSFGQDARTSG